MKKILLLALCAAATLGGCQDKREELYRDVNSPSAARRAGAVRVLWQVGDQDAYRLATGALDDDSPAVRLAAVRALADFKKIDPFQALTRAARNSEKTVRRLAAEKIAAFDRPESRGVLLDLLAVHELDPENRLLLARLLRQDGLDPEALNREIAVRMAESWRSQWSRAPLAQRTRMARLAARLADERALEIVRLALTDSEAEVTESALENLDGLGGGEITRLLARMYADASSAVRARLLDEFSRREEEGWEFIFGALFSAQAQTRLAALRLLPRRCPNNADANQPPGEKNCPPTELVRALEKQPDVAFGLASCSALLAVQDAALPTEEKRLAAARACMQSGVFSPATTTLVKNRLDRLLKDLKTYRGDWIGGRILPREAAPGARAPAPAAGPPRNTEDILARFATRQETAFYRRLFPPLADEFVDELWQTAQAWLGYRPADCGLLLRELLLAPSANLAARAAQAARQCDVRLEIDAALRDNLLMRLNEAEAEQAGWLGRWMASSGDGELLQAVLTEMKYAPWEKNRRLIAALEGNAQEKALEALEKQLSGENASTAALLLARMGRRQILPTINELLTKAVGQARLELLEALALLGEKRILAELEVYLFDPEPDVRLQALEIAQRLPRAEIAALLQQARWDTDRRVRLKAKEFFQSGDQP